LTGDVVSTNVAPLVLFLNELLALACHPLQEGVNFLLRKK
jgi:hypothetical protein